ncbi:aliphatic sulfonates transport permease [Caballeronia fortuita]|uniref:Aliphatic sulfonates transport permease n=1 Tax=Caballeronia fortuita TaxID=1777138 RepID=A0A158ABJ9_9BURK|nr:ABC transporter permease [Caballeronia fortuita]SAK54477.1 aliphatic sulfonates transport permease [Caballeronia fortuita]
MKTAQKLTAPAVRYKSSSSRLKRWFSGNNRDRMISIASPVVLLIVWQILAETGVIDERFFPAPSKVFGTFIALVNDGSLWENTWATLQRLFWGTLAGGIPALMLGVAIGLSRPLRAVFDPLIAATYPVPKSAIFPLLLLICGLGEASKIVMVAIGVFFPVLINTATGVLEINKIYLDVGRNFRASRWQVFRTIALPGAVPHIMSGIKLGIGLGLMLIAIAEMIGSKSGLGYMIWNAWELLSVEQMYVGLLVIAALGYIISVVLTELERKLIPWKSSR